MELDAFDVERSMTRAHDLSAIAPRRDLELGRERFALDDERVIPAAQRRGGNPFEEAGARVMDRRCLAVHDLAAPNDAASEGVPDRLMAETDTEDRHDAFHRVDRVERDTGFERRARPGRDQEAVEIALGDL